MNLYIVNLKDKAFIHNYEPESFDMGYLRKFHGIKVGGINKGETLGILLVDESVLIPLKQTCQGVCDEAEKVIYDNLQIRELLQTAEILEVEKKGLYLFDNGFEGDPPFYHAKITYTNDSLCIREDNVDLSINQFRSPKLVYSHNPGAIIVFKALNSDSCYIWGNEIGSPFKGKIVVEGEINNSKEYIVCLREPYTFLVQTGEVIFVCEWNGNFFTYSEKKNMLYPIQI